VPPPQPQRLSTICWISAATLSAFLCLTQCGAMLSVLCRHTGLGMVAPAGALLALGAGYLLAAKSPLTAHDRWWPLALAAGTLAASLVISSWYFDLSWDGQWYHQTAIYAIARDWNPLGEPMREFLPHLQLWVRHYAKGPWYVAAAIYRTIGLIECGKCTALIAWAAMALSVFASGLDLGLRRWPAAAIAFVVSMNPVVMSELTSYLVDGILFGFLVLTTAAVISAIARPRAVVIVAGLLAAIVCINAKLTGLVFVCFVLAAGWAWCVIRKREILWPYTGLAALALSLGVLVFGYNPYVTNTLHRHQPFYPVLGSAAFPSLTDQGREGIELYETPKNLVGRSRFVRIAYATFGRPGNAPYANVRDAALMFPFAARPSDLHYYQYHEARIAGFGPFFSGALLIAGGLGIVLAFQTGPGRWWAALAAAAILGSLFISLHLWWPRYGPQLWLLPIIPAALLFADGTSQWLRAGAWILTGLLAINACIVAAVHLSWETRASQTLRRQLTELRNGSGEIEISLRYFEIPVGERLTAWGIRFQKRSRDALRDATPLMSVVEGYPGEIKFRLGHPAPVGPAAKP